MRKSSIPSGVRDFNAATIAKRAYIIETIRSTFLRYGFEPLETPAMEQYNTLMGKYGEEGEKLLFKILNNGIHLQKNPGEIQEAIAELLKSGHSSSLLTERALRYDLTIPLARYVAMHQEQLTFPFRRFQIGQVWRADRPQKGRYREFVQCDADIIGDNTSWCEIELCNIYLEVFEMLELDVKLLINHRHIIQSLKRVCGLSENDHTLPIALDKIDKVGIASVLDILTEKGYSEKSIDIIKVYLSIGGEWHQQLDQLESLLGEMQHVREDITKLMRKISSTKKVALSPKLARGLEYYTGCIMEVVPQHQPQQSIGGGGRYHNLTSLFGASELAGVGISFGIDRIYDHMKEGKLFPKNIEQKNDVQVLFFNMGEKESEYAYQTMQRLRTQGNVRCELISRNSKLDKQFQYANKKHIPYIIIIGEKEITNNQYTLKHLPSGEQWNLTWDELRNYPFLDESIHSARK